jgi:hypothetical protein
MRRKSSIYNMIYGNLKEGIVFNEKTNQLQVPVNSETHYYVFAGGTKPYHAGHDMLVNRIVQDALANPHPNKAICLFIGLSSRQEGEDQLLVTGDQVQSVWTNIVEPRINQISGDVPVYIEYGGGPVGKVLAMMKSANEATATGFKMFLYTDEEDVKKYYRERKYKKNKPKTPEFELKSSPPNYYSNLRVAARGEDGYSVDGSDIMFMGELEPDMLPRVTSGSAKRRSAQAGSREGFVSGLPEYVRNNPELLAKYMEIMGLSHLNESKSLNEINRSDKGTPEYSVYLQEMIDELQYIKGSYNSRKKLGKQYRKEASLIQNTISELKRQKRKNDRLNEIEKENTLNENKGIDNRSVLKEWFSRNYKRI